MAEPTPNRIIPLPLAIMILVAVLLAGGGGVAWYLLRPPPTPPGVMNAVVPSAGNPRVARIGPANSGPIDPVATAREVELPDGVYERPGDELLIKSGDAYARLVRIDGRDRLRLGFFTLSNTQWDHGYLSQGVRRILVDESFRKSLDVTETQLATLKKLPAPPADWPDDDRQKLLDAFVRYRASMGEKRVQIGQELVALLGPSAKRKQQSDQAAMAARISQIRTILTPEQVEAVNPIPKWDLPGTRP